MWNSTMAEILLLLLLASTNGQNVLQLVVKTGGVFEDGCDDCLIQMSITNSNLDTCEITYLDSAANDFEEDVSNGYEGAELESCLGFLLPGLLADVTLFHSQPDAWMPEYVRIILDDGTWVECPNSEGILLDDSSFVTLPCLFYGAS